MLLRGDGGWELQRELWSLKLSELPPIDILIGCQCVLFGPIGEDCNNTKSVSIKPHALFVRER